MSDMIRRLDRRSPVVRSSICLSTLHPLTHAAEASNVERVQRYRLDNWRRGCPMALCDMWDKGDSLLCDDGSIDQFDGYSPRI
jgi:hypothetical protein